MKILVCGDMIFNSNHYSDDAFYLEIKQFINNNCYDFITANLEGPFTDSNEQISKNGPSLKYHDSYVSLIKGIGIKLVTLANNHIMDYGIKGLESTIHILTNNGIEYIGTKKEENAKNVYFYEKDNVKVAFYSVCENEFSSWERFGFGAYSLDVFDVINDIKRIRNECDCLIVLFHGGKELFPFPTPWNQKICRAFIDSGADYVFQQHSHVIGSIEKYKNGTIVYGQGDFINKKTNKENSILFEILVKKPSSDYNIIYIDRQKEDNVIKPINKNENDLYLNDTYGLVEKNYREWLSKNPYFIFYQILRKNRMYQIFDIHCFNNKLIKRAIRKNKEYILLLLNYVSCETHRETLITLLEDSIK